MLWDLAVLCQHLLILPIARQPQGLCGWVTQGGPSTLRTPEPMLAAPTYLPHQSIDAQTPLAVIEDPGLPEAEDTSGGRMEVTFAAQRSETLPLHPSVALPWQLGRMFC